MSGKKFGCLCFAAMALCLTIPSASLCYGVREGGSGLGDLALVAQELRVPATDMDIKAISEGFAAREAVSRFIADNGTEWTALIDLRRGVPSLLDGGAIPFIPGSMNSLYPASFGSDCRSARCISREKVEAAAREFIAKYSGMFPVRQEELFLDREGTLPIGDSFYLVRFGWAVKGIPVEGASIYFRINNGNLIQVASTGISSAPLQTVPSIPAETAWEILNGYLGKERVTQKDEILDRGRLVIIPVTPKGMKADVYQGPPGAMAAYDLAYRLAFRRPGIPGTWEAIIDARSGEILRFVDSNRYGVIRGGVYKTDANPVQSEVVMPFPFADYGAGAYSDMSGTFPGVSGTSTMTGRTGSAGNVGGVDIVDSCGSISLAADATGSIDFGGGPGTDCATPGIGGTGNTHSARTQFYNVAWIKIKAYTYLSSNSWLQGLLTDNVNINDTCNAYWNGSSVNFFRSGGGCGNTGEIPGVSLHEWGHGMDDYDGSGGDSPPVETRADWTAILQTHQSCAGGGFFMSYNPGCGTPPSQSAGYHNCRGYGDCCLDCSGIRDADWAKHASNTPWTAANKGTVWNCSGGSYFGPCGWEDHCESGIATQALWDLAVRDLPAYCGMDATSAWQLIDRLWYSSMPQMGAMYSCTPPNSSGSGATSLFNLFRAFDDSGDGTANGTPHAQAIFQAFNRHNIASGAAGDPSNQNQTTCPALAVSTLSGAAGSNSAVLDWGDVPGAARYFIFRNDTSCDSGFVKIATVAGPTLTYTDPTAVNGVASYYRMQAATAEDACVSAMSNCVSVTPQPCAGTILLDRTIYNCSATVNITVLDSTVSAPVSVEAWSGTDGTHKVIALGGAPSSYSGSLSLTSGAAGAGQVQVADGDTLYVRYVDPDYCGSPGVAVGASAAIDCAGPVISNVQVAGITGLSATVTFDTDEAAAGGVVYDTAFPPFARLASDPSLAYSHSIGLAGLTECTRFYYYVTATDAAGNSATDNNGGSYYSFRTQRNTAPIYSKVESPPLSIPDNNTTTGASSVIQVPDVKMIQDVNVMIGSITHPYDADLDIYLIPPDGTTIELSTDNGGSGDNYIGTIFDAESVTPITAGTPPFGGSYKPEGNLTLLYGKSAQGSWTLKVYDDAAGDVGTINGWGLQFSYPPESCPESAGTVFFEDPVYGCLNDQLTLQVQDLDLLGTGSVGVEVWSDSEAVPETLVLAENPPSSATFKGLIATTTAAPVSGDGVVSTAGGSVHARYIDADDGAGGTNVERLSDALIDCQGPVISNIIVSGVTATSATVSWMTDVPADSALVYGISAPPGSVLHDAALVTAHSITADGLLPCAAYYFSVVSADEFGNPATDDNGGAWHAFETFGGNSSTYTYSGSPTAIPDPGTISVPISVTESGTITDVNVRLNINHTWDADLDLYLVHPDGTVVELSTDNGGSGDNYVNTLFDDSAPTAITAGTAPFTGTYRPEGLLSTLNGREMSGNWSLQVTDDTSTDSGTFLNYSLELSYSRPCGPSLGYYSHSFTDSCYGAGSGGDGIIDAGEDVELRLVLANTGSSDATGVAATMTTASPDAVVTDGSASFPDIPSQSSGGSLAPHFVIHISESAACGEVIPLHFAATCAGAVAPFEGDFSLTVGSPFSIPGEIITESFDGTTFPPAGWAQVDVNGTAGNWARSANTVHPANGGTHSGAGLAYFNSYSASSGSSTRLYTTSTYQVPASATACELSFYMYHDGGYSTSADRIQPQVSLDGTTWSNAGGAINRFNGSTGWSRHAVDLTAYTGQAVMVGLLGVSGYGNDCHIDDLSLSYSTPGCSMNQCIVCVPPSAPLVEAADADPCTATGVAVTFAAGLPATRHDLYVDGVLAQTGIVSPATYIPGDTLSHQYSVRAVNGADSCFTDSAAAAASDLSGGSSKPVITSIVDVNPYNRGLKITYTPGTPAQRHDLYKDGVLAFASFPSGGVYSYTDILTHSYQIAAVRGACLTFSDPVTARDLGPTFREKTRLDLEPLPPPATN